MSSPRGLIRASLALLLAYALAFAPALAQAARGQMAAMPDATADLCLALPDGGGPAHEPGKGQGAAHEDCCLAGCRLAPVAAAAPSADLPSRDSRLIRAAEPLPSAQASEPLRCETPPATGPPACA